MSEKSEVQNLSGPTVATEPLDAGPPAADAKQVQQGEPKEYLQDADNDTPHPAGVPTAGPPRPDRPGPRHAGTPAGV